MSNKPILKSNEVSEFPCAQDFTVYKTVNNKYKISQDSNGYINVCYNMLFLFYVLIIVNYKDLLILYLKIFITRILDFYINCSFILLCQ